MRRYFACLLVTVLVFNPLLAGDPASIRDAWSQVMKDHGVKPGEGLPEKQWNLTLDELTKISRETGFEPSSSIPQGQWELLYEKAQQKAKAGSNWLEPAPSVQSASNIPTAPAIHPSTASAAAPSLAVPVLPMSPPLPAGIPLLSSDTKKEFGVLALSSPTASANVSVSSASATPIILTQAQKGMPPVNLGPMTPIPSEPPANAIAMSAPMTDVGLSPAMSTALSRDTSLQREDSKTKSLTLDMREMDIVEALKIFSRQTGLNIVIGKNVSGRVTVFMKDVDCWTALRQILETRDLAYVQEDGLVKIIAEQDYERVYGEVFGNKIKTKVLFVKNIKAKTAKDVLDSIKSKVGTIAVNEVNNSLILEDTPEKVIQMEKMAGELDLPMETRIFKLNYGIVDDIMPKINSLVSKDYGNIQADKRSNTIIVKDNPARVQEMADIIKAFDAKNKAVLIEAKIVQVTLNDNFQWGINWQGVDWTYFFNKMKDYHVSGSLVQNMLLVPQGTVAPGNVTASGVTASVGVLEKPNFSAVANFLQTVGNTKLLSSPRIMALNNQEAKIHVGSKEAKITRTLLNVGSTTSNPVTTENVEFLDVGVQLAVTPSIGDDGMITMKVKPEVSSVERTITTTEGSSIPVIRVSEAESSLVVKDGITVVIGGLIEDSRSNTEVKVPILGSIPLIGYFFRSQNKTVAKTELVIFLTPHIVTGDVVPTEAQDRFNLQPDGTPKKKRGFFSRLFGKA